MISPLMDSSPNWCNPASTSRPTFCASKLSSRRNAVPGFTQNASTTLGLLDGLDGALARKTGTSSKYGDFLDHVIDRYADVFIISGIFLGGYLRADLGALAVTGVLLASYLGTQAQAVGIGRNYGGIMGRADRMIVLGLATCITLVYPVAAGFEGFRFPVLGWALLLIGVLSHVTALQRIWHARKSLLYGDKK
jgi:phosphatidylglycerophosphate synthase